MNDNEIPFGKSSYEIILEHVDQYDFPVCFKFPVGHETGNIAIPCSRNGKLVINDEYSELSFS